MAQDIDTLFATIEKVHPDMYAVYPKEQLDKDIERVKAKLAPSGDIAYFYKQVTPLVTQLGDGHTSTVPSFLGGKDFANALLFPFSVKITYPDKEIFIQGDYTQTQNTIPIDAQIVSINSRNADSIAQKMMNYASGEKDFFKTKIVTQLFSSLLYVLYRDSIFEVEYMHNQEKYSVQVKGISSKERNKVASQQDKFNAVPRCKNYSFTTLPEKNIGVIEFNEFIDMGKFKVFLDTTFRRLQKENVGNLIIDIRKNGGGDTDLGEELFQYISPVPFSQFSKVVAKYSDIQKQQQKPHYEKMYKQKIVQYSGLKKLRFKRAFKSEVKSELSTPNGTIRTYDISKLIELRENNLRYTGNVYVLTSHASFSAASVFSWAFKYFKMGTVVGEETGSPAVLFGYMLSQKLPNTELSYTFSCRKFYNYGATDENTHGTLPDHEIAAEKALDFTVELIERKNSKTILNLY
ncbi:MAG: hypothetical protein LBU92_06220 [Prevotellaceae bacterium]|jgi:hypothetical protein|nr:hypothetical protein [Prevotellaceae bacterium]